MVGRRVTHHGMVLLGTLLLSGCTGERLLSPSLQSDSAAVAAEAEAFPVRRVDRSKFDDRLRPQIVPFHEPFAPGSVLVDSGQHFLFLVLPGGKAKRYGIAVGASGKAWRGRAIIDRKAKWPAWFPTDDMRNDAPGLPRRIAPGPANPLGARALYLASNGKDTLYRIHGTSEPWTIGTDASSGCIRMFNEDVIDLYEQVAIGAVVTVR